MLFFKWYIRSLGAILAFLAMDYSFTLFGVPSTLLFLLESMEHLGLRMVSRRLRSCHGFFVGTGFEYNSIASIVKKPEMLSVGCY